MAGEGDESMVIPYQRQLALVYAHRWAFSRNPAFYNYDELGGDCTNFISQCVLAGGGVMNDTPTFGWYYKNGNEKSPSWTGVPYFFNFMTRADASIGPFGRNCVAEEAVPGDVIQLSFNGESYQHSLLIVRVLRTRYRLEFLTATHSFDADYRPVSSYPYQKIRFLHLEGIRITGE